MKFIGGIICLFAILVAIAADAIYIPKSFYKISENGETSQLYHISSADQSELLHRLRRQVVSSSSSSSSSSTSNGGPTYFTQQTAVHTDPGFGLASRFGDDDNYSSGGTGVYTSTHGFIDKYGQVHYNTEKGKL